jgi:glycosyltransferase involved in cell wall biosynthesis
VSEVTACVGPAVVVPVHNRAKTILATLDSVAGQTLPPSRLIVVDDGSTDGLQASLAGWLARERPLFPVRLLKQGWCGAPIARNRGLAEAGAAETVAFLDSDDRWPADFLRRAQEVLARRPDAVAVTTDRMFVDGLTGQSELSDMLPIARCATAWMFANHTGIGSATLLRAAAVRRLGGFDPALPTGHDAALFLRLSLLGPWLHGAGAPVVYGRNAALSRGEYDHLRHHFVNHEHRWAAIREEFIEHGGGRAALPEALCNEHMARRWYRAGRIWYRAGRMRAARQCFLRSLRYARSGRTMVKLVGTWVRRAA